MLNTKITVICSKCGTPATFLPPDGKHPNGSWKWDYPCPNCGAEAWGAHDVDRDWRTGDLLKPEVRWEKTE